MSKQQLLELKGWGHQLIKGLAEKRGITQDEVYKLIAKERGVREYYCHFGRADAVEAQLIIDALLRLLKRSVRPSPSKAFNKALRKANKAVPQSTIRAAIAALPKPRVPWYRKFITFFK